MDINTTTIDAIYQNLRKDFEDGINEAKPIADPLFKVVPSTSNANAYSWLAHIPGFREWFKGESRVLRNVETLDYTVANRKFEDSIVISEDEVKDNQLSQFSTISSEMGTVGRLVWDEIVFSLFNNGFTTTLTYDSKTWFANDHTVGIGTIDNLATAALSETSLKAAITAMMNYKVQPDKLSTARPLNPSQDLILLVPPALNFTAKALVENEKDAGGADNELYKAAKIMVSSWLTSSTAWFLLNVAGGQKPVYLQDRESLKLINKNPMTSDYSLMTDNLLFTGKMRCAALPTHPWLAYGSTGLT
jgi:phage major head subunit gpT-like protein